MSNEGATISTRNLDELGELAMLNFAAKVDCIVLRCARSGRRTKILVRPLVCRTHPWLLLFAGPAEARRAGPPLSCHLLRRPGALSRLPQLTLKRHRRSWLRRGAP